MPEQQQQHGWVGDQERSEGDEEEAEQNEEGLAMLGEQLTHVWGKDEEGIPHLLLGCAAVHLPMIKAIGMAPADQHHTLTLNPACNLAGTFIRSLGWCHVGIHLKQEVQASLHQMCHDREKGQHQQGHSAGEDSCGSFLLHINCVKQLQVQQDSIQQSAIPTTSYAV
jgi:hypothetical protein